MTTILGFEGAWPDGVLVAWGAAILADEDQIRNSLSGQFVLRDELDDYLVDGVVTRFPNPIPLTNDGHGVIVLAIRRDTKHDRHFKPARDPDAGVIHTTWTKDLFIAIFTDLPAFRSYGETVGAATFATIARNEVPQGDIEPLLTAGLIVAPTNPYLLALKASRSSGNDTAVALLRRRCKGDVALTVFDEVLASVTARSRRYEVKYTHGVASRGGLDVRVASRQLHALFVIQGELTEEIQEDVPFRIRHDEVPTIHLRELKAASATMSFDTAEADDETAMTRYLRFLQMKRLKRILDGELPKAAREDTAFLEALARFVKPDEDTVVEHQGFDAEHFAVVEYRPAPAQAYVPSEIVHCLGFVEGIFDRLGKVEIGICPGQTLKMSTRSDGEGGQPRGTALFAARNDYLFRPVRVTMRRHLAPNGELKVWLHELTLLKPGEATTIDYLPSGFLDGTLVRLAARISTTEEGDIVVNWLFRNPDHGPQPSKVVLRARHTEHGAESWLADLAKHASAIELERADDAVLEWVRIGRRSRPAPYMRYLFEIAEVRGQVRLGALRQRLVDRYGWAPSKQSIAGVLRTYTELFSENPDGTWKLSFAGDRLRVVLEKAGMA